MADLREHADLAARLLRRLAERASFAEAMLQRAAGETIHIDAKSVRASVSPRLAGLVVRAWAGTHWVEGAASSFESDAVARLGDEIAGGLAGAASTSAPPGESSTTVGERETQAHHPMRDVGSEDLIDIGRDLYRWATSVPGIRLAQVGVLWSDDERLYLNTAGANCRQLVSRPHAYAAPIATESGQSKVYPIFVGGIGGREIVDRLSEGDVATASRAALELLHAKAPPTGSMNVVLDPGTTATFVHESFGHGAEADQFVRDRSYLRPLLGQSVGPETLTIVDDGSIPDGWGSVYFDDEGHPGQRTALIDRGRFVGALYDRESAAMFGAHATGNTRRSDFLGRTFVRMTNTLLEPQDWSVEELVEEARDGVMLEHWVSGVEDPQGGQMQIKVATGHRIENGRLAERVGSMALSGKVLHFLRDIRGIGRAQEFGMTPGFCGKGHSDMLPVGDGGPYLLSRAVIGPA